MNSPQRPPSSRRFQIWWFIGGFAIIDFLSFPVVDYGVRNFSPEVLLMGLIYAVMTGQLGLLAIWGVFGPRRVLVRLPLTLAVTVFLLASFFAGSAFIDTGGGPDLDEMACASLCLPLLLLAAQLPLWILKLVTGGRIVHIGAETPQSPTRQQQFGVGHLMATTVVVAVALGLASSNQRLFDIRQDELWIPLAVFCLIFCLSSLFAALPCLWAGLGAKNPGAGAVGLVIYAVFMICLLTGVLHLFQLFVPRSMPGEPVLLLLSFCGFLMFVTLGPLYAVRFYGYRYQRGGRPQPIVRTGSPFASCDETSASARGAQSPAFEPEQPPEPGDAAE